MLPSTRPTDPTITGPCWNIDAFDMHPQFSISGPDGQLIERLTCTVLADESTEKLLSVIVTDGPADPAVLHDFVEAEAANTERRAGEPLGPIKLRIDRSTTFMRLAEMLPRDRYEVLLPCIRMPSSPGAAERLFARAARPFREAGGRGG